MANTDEIRERWASRNWPSIGYFVHGQAYKDIQALLAHIDDMAKPNQPDNGA